MLLIFLIGTVIAFDQTQRLRSILCGCNTLTVDECLYAEWCQLKGATVECQDEPYCDNIQQLICEDMELETRCGDYDLTKCSELAWCEFKDNKCQSSQQIKDSKAEQQTLSETIRCRDQYIKEDCLTTFQDSQQCIWLAIAEFCDNGQICDKQQCVLAQDCTAYEDEKECMMISTCDYNSDSQACESCVKSIYNSIANILMISYIIISQS